ncbi:uncharacterized protein LOC133726056 [Rosa rugosa]|uniref:uncharacterized protein LOC133726056 n=1 Tax=Rosa rugosa TaxID=74645 RepID=UPI002B409017|nr:uncharacterized protein LOC133726056 [Rosa rugosa]
MAGDFNEIMCNADKSGGVSRATAPMRRFRETMSNCDLLDMGFVGSRFTWSNKYTKERLDRAFQSLSWSNNFPFSRVVTLSPSESDHCPILVEVKKDQGTIRRAQKRFRFEEMWHGNEHCASIIQQNWSQPLTGNALHQLGRKIQSTGEQLLHWHQNEFEKQKVELCVVQEKLNDIMKEPYSPLQYEEQHLLHVKLSQILAQQEKYWRQRSRAIWLKDGDRNSAFFHRKASNRRIRNTIKGLVNSAGEWQFDPETIKSILMDYYRGIFRTDDVDDSALVEILNATPVKKNKRQKK